LPIQNYLKLHKKLLKMVFFPLIFFFFSELDLFRCIGLGEDREANLLRACESVENLMEISNSLIPYAEEESPWGNEVEPEVDASQLVFIILFIIFLS